MSLRILYELTSCKEPDLEDVQDALESCDFHKKQRVLIPPSDRQAWQCLPTGWSRLSTSSPQSRFFLFPEMFDDESITLQINDVYGVGFK